MDKVRGHSKRSLQIPGYHLHPKYDLVHTRHLLHQRGQKKGFSLNLAPMVDMFSILVIYLIMNFSATGEVFFMGKDIAIPQALKGRPMESFPLVSVVKDEVQMDAPHPGGSGSLFIVEKNDGQSPQFREKLKELKELELKVRGPEGFAGQVNIQADSNIEIEEVKKVMRILVEEGWTTINFIVEPNSRLTYQ